jgi:predicted metalloendopeptidase
MEPTLISTLKLLDQSLPVQYRSYYAQLINTPSGSRQQCLVFAHVATTAASYLRASIESTQFTLENAENLLDDTGDGHEALKETLETMEEHNKAARALHEALGVWRREEQSRIDTMRADMEEVVEMEKLQRAKARRMR